MDSKSTGMVTRSGRRLSVDKLETKDGDNTSGCLTPTKRRTRRLSAKPELEDLPEVIVSKDDESKAVSEAVVKASKTELQQHSISENVVDSPCRNLRKRNISLLSPKETKTQESFTPKKAVRKIESSLMQNIVDSPKMKKNKRLSADQDSLQDVSLRRSRRLSGELNVVLEDPIREEQDSLKLPSTRRGKRLSIMPEHPTLHEECEETEPPSPVKTTDEVKDTNEGNIPSLNDEKQSTLSPVSVTLQRLHPSQVHTDSSSLDRMDDSIDTTETSRIRTISSSSSLQMIKENLEDEAKVNSNSSVQDKVAVNEVEESLLMDMDDFIDQSQISQNAASPHTPMNTRARTSMSQSITRSSERRKSNELHKQLIQSSPLLKSPGQKRKSDVARRSSECQNEHTDDEHSKNKTGGSEEINSVKVTPNKSAQNLELNLSNDIIEFDDNFDVSQTQIECSQTEISDKKNVSLDFSPQRDSSGDLLSFKEGTPANIIDKTSSPAVCTEDMNRSSSAKKVSFSPKIGIMNKSQEQESSESNTTIIVSPNVKLTNLRQKKLSLSPKMRGDESKMEDDSTGASSPNKAALETSQHNSSAPKKDATPSPRKNKLSLSPKNHLNLSPKKSIAEVDGELLTPKNNLTNSSKTVVTEEKSSPLISLKNLHSKRPSSGSDLDKSSEKLNESNKSIQMSPKENLNDSRKKSVDSLNSIITLKNKLNSSSPKLNNSQSKDANTSVQNGDMEIFDYKKTLSNIKDLKSSSSTPRKDDSTHVSNEQPASAESEENDSDDGDFIKLQLIDESASEAESDYKSGDSLNESEKEEMEMNKIVEKGESLYSEEDEESDVSSYEKDSFVCSDDEPSADEEINKDLPDAAASDQNKNGADSAQKIEGDWIISSLQSPQKTNSEEAGNPRKRKLLEDQKDAGWTTSAGDFKIVDKVIVEKPSRPITTSNHGSTTNFNIVTLKKHPKNILTAPAGLDNFKENSLYRNNVRKDFKTSKSIQQKMKAFASHRHK